MTFTFARRRAFTITEMMAVLILLSAFAVIATRLFTSTIKLGHNYGQAQDAATSAGFALTLLRGDVATAKDFKSPNASTVEITTPDDKAITWTIQSNKLVRIQAKEQRQWPTPAGGASFAINESSVILKFTDPDFGEMWMSNQGKLTEKLTQP
jgi:prepilin-type N-terminal cleavage/methylation domain-containing protein